MTKVAVMVSWDDIPHISEQQKTDMLASIPPWQRDARSKGIPDLGPGAIYGVPESDFVISGIELPPHFPRAYALDVGWNRTAALWGARDLDTNTVYIYDEYYRQAAEPSIHAAAIKNRGAWIPGVIDPAARGRSQKDGEALYTLYEQLGLDILPANNAREAGIYAVWEMLSQGRIKVFRSCQNFLSEYRIYRRDDKGQVVKKNDHLMDAIRYLVMSGLDRAIIQPNLIPGQRWFDLPTPGIWSN